jgi:hypothetical protein
MADLAARGESITRPVVLSTQAASMGTNDRPPKSTSQRLRFRGTCHRPMGMHYTDRLPKLFFEKHAVRRF